MSKVGLTVVREPLDKVMDCLHSVGAIEIEDAAPPEGEEAVRFRPDSNAEYWLANVKFAIALIGDYREAEKKGLLEKLRGGMQTVEPERLKEVMERAEYKEVVVELENLDKEINAARNRIAQNRKERGFLEVWKDLPEIPGPEGRYVRFRVGTVPLAQFEEFRRAWESLGAAELHEVNEIDKETCLALACAKDLEEEASEVLEQFGFKAADINFGTNVSIGYRAAEIDKELESDNQKLAELKERVRQFGPKLADLQVAHDCLRWKADQDEASRQALATEQTVSLAGWLPQDRIAEVREGLDAITDKYLLEELPIGEEEDIPVQIRNRKAIAPFESVTEIYGAPQYDEPDPTVYLAPFFILYFALCLTDAGYGLLLALMAVVAIKLMQPKGGTRKIMRLMAMGGVATFIIGALFGGWFGITIDNLPEGAARSLLLGLRLINPVENPMTVLVLSFILGFIQMIAGNVINLVWKIRHGQAREGWLGSGMWTAFLLIIGFWIATKAGVLPAWTAKPALYLLWAGVVGMILTQGHEKKNLFMKLFSGVASLYGLVGYLSDILSYSRLLALGLSTGIIAMVVNLVANLFAGMVPYVGWLVWLLIIVGGHLFNLAINVLGAFIHSGRLQYVEYFPKFMTGGGRKFKPLVRTAKYVSSP